MAANLNQIKRQMRIVFKKRLFDWSKICEHYFENHFENVKNETWKDTLKGLNRPKTRQRDSWTEEQLNISHFMVP